MKPKHIQNLRVFIDRESLLGILPKHAVVAEAGVARGDFSESILAITEPRELHLIDSWIHDGRYLNMKELVENRFGREIELAQVQIHQGFSTTELEKFPGGYFDWVYIDTGHDYHTTTEELEICRHILRKGGIIAGHDYVKGAWLTRTRFGVIEAVNEFCLRYEWEMIGLTHECHRHLSYALRQISI